MLLPHSMPQAFDQGCFQDLQSRTGGNTALRHNPMNRFHLPLTQSILKNLKAEVVPFLISRTFTTKDRTGTASPGNLTRKAMLCIYLLFIGSSKDTRSAKIQSDIRLVCLKVYHLAPS